MSRRGWATVGIAVTVLSGASPSPVRAQGPADPGAVPVRPVAFRADPLSPEFGQAFALHLTLRIAPGTLLLLPDTLVPGEASQSAGGVSWRTEPTVGDSLDVIATYPVMGLANGEVELPTLEAATRPAEGAAAGVLRLGGEEGAGGPPARPFALRIGRVQVIPHRALGDVEGPPPVRPPADVVGGNWSVWAIVAAFVGAGLAGLAALYAAGLWRRLADGRRAVSLRRLPRRDALAALERLLASGWHRTGRVDAFYQEASEIFRGFAAKTQSGWGEDLTSTELVGRIIEREGPDTTGDLRPAVLSGEGVRFGTNRPGSELAEEHVGSLARWIARTESAPPENGSPAPTGSGRGRAGPSVDEGGA